MEPYFKTENLAVGYDGQVLIPDICVHLEKGKILTLIGPTGVRGGTGPSALAAKGIGKADGGGADGSDSPGAHHLCRGDRHGALSLYQSFWASDPGGQKGGTGRRTGAA